MLELKYINGESYCKLEDHCQYTGKYRGAANTICKFKFSKPKELPVVFHNGSNYDYNSIIRDLAKEIKAEFNGLGQKARNI